MVLPVERKQIVGPDRRQQRGAEARLRELDVLDPARGRMPLIGRERELSDLRAWLDDEVDISVHALIGSAGTGKTRLSIGLCAAIDGGATPGAGWLAGFLSPAHLPRLADVFATTAFDWTRSTLLVIDYAAQGYEALGRWLDHLAAGPRLQGAKLRILLLERQAPEGFGWWQELCASPRNAAAGRRDLFWQPRPEVLAGLADIEVRRRILAEALGATAALHRTAPRPVPPAEADPVLDARLSEPVFGNALSLVMAGVIGHETGLRAALALRRLDAARRLGGRELDRFADLAGAGAEAQAIRHLLAFNALAGGLPVAGLGRQLRDELAALGATANTQRLSELMQQELPSPARRDGADATARLATIQPDLIGEAVIVEAFETTPERRVEALATLRRAYALTGPAAAQALMRLLQDYAYAVEDPRATKAEYKTGTWLLSWLRSLAADLADPEALEPLAFALPHQTLVLRDIAAEITGRLAAAHDAALQAEGDASVQSLYRAMVWKGNHANRLHNLGSREAALAAAEQAVGLARRLTEGDAETFRDDLATSLNTLANSLSALGRREEALAVAQEAVDLYRALAAARPDAFTPALAASLNNLAASLSELGRREEALAVAQEAVDLRRALAAARPDAFTPNLATSLNNLANRLSELGRREEALAVAQEAVDLTRALAAARPDAFTPALAASLNNLAASLSALGRREEALAVAQEAVDIYRALAAARPDAFAPDLAMSLNTLANRLSALGRREEALAVAQEAADLYRALAAARPDAFTPDLAGSLNNLAAFLSDLGRREEALAAAQEAVDLYRALAAARPDAFTPNLATSLNNLAGFLSALGRREEALAVAQEAVDLYRALAAGRSDAFTPYLAGSLNNLAGFLSALGRREEALELAQEAVDLRRTLAAARPEAFTPALAASLNNLANFLSDLGRREEALVVAQEAVDLRRTLAAARPEAFSVDLSISLGMFTDLMIAMNDKPRALVTMTEAITVLTPTFVAMPQAVAQWMITHLRRYVSLCQELEREPDEAWLRPVLEVFARLQREAGEDSGGA
ncbi:hypothetical protein U713_04780 [Rhodobacter capsulatus YW2]|nr:hypothetical protein U713_04780 [Rhodobacter capsulatus YW2]